MEKHTFSFIDMYSNPKTMELTPCERKILEEYGKRKSTKSIADKLCCSIFTVNSHRQNIMHKMEIKEMSEFRFKQFHFISKKWQSNKIHTYCYIQKKVS